MKILFFGDVVGSDAVGVLAEYLPRWRATTGADVVIANIENAFVCRTDVPTHAFGIDDESIDRLLAAGVDVLTGGNHSWDAPGYEVVLERPKVLRPHNVVHPAAGRGVLELTVAGQRLLVINLLGKTATYPPLEARDALAVFDELTIAPATTVFVDFHAEMTLEKRTFAHAVDGRAAAVIGTHTHEPSLRLERFPGGTFFVADAGMVGPSGGVVGMAPDWYVRRMRGNAQPGFTLADGPVQVGAIVLDLGDRQTIERFLPENSVSSVR